MDSAITEEEIGLQGEGEIPDTVSEEGYQSESSSSDDSDDEIISTQKLYVDGNVFLFFSLILRKF